MKVGSSLLDVLCKKERCFDGWMTVHVRLTLFASCCLASYKPLRGRKRVKEGDKYVKVDVSKMERRSLIHQSQKRWNADALNLHRPPTPAAGWWSRPSDKARIIISTFSNITSKSSRSTTHCNKTNFRLRYVLYHTFLGSPYQGKNKTKKYAKKDRDDYVGSFVKTVMPHITSRAPPYTSAKSATGATSSTKLRVRYAALPTSVWPRVPSIHVPWSISPVQRNTRWSLPSGNITRPSIRRWRPPWISEFSNNAETNFAFTSKKPWKSSVIAHNLIVVTKTWVQVFWFEVLCAVSRDHDRALVIFVLTMSQSIFIFLCNWLVIISLSHEFFLPFSPFSPFFVSSFDPLAPQSRFHLNLAKALLASLYMRTTIFLSSRMGFLTQIFHPFFTKLTMA